LHRFLRFLLGAASHLPLRLLHAFGAALGWAMYGMSPTYRRHLNENLARAGYGADASLRRDAIASAGKMIAELPALWFRPHEEVVSLVREVTGLDEARAVHERGEPLLVLTPHMGCFEIISLYAARIATLTVLYRPPKLRALEPLMREGRARPGVRLVPADVTGVRELFGALRRNEVVGFLPDQVPGEGEGEWTEFFGAPAYTMTLAAKLAERPGVTCFLAYGRRLPGGRGYDIVLRPYPAALPGESATRRLNRALEGLVRECPAQYLWGYNRYKTPRGARPR
jgi:KDO2-lipid IV(A) lauroyltransferase